jgi:hypothetical protein
VTFNAVTAIIDADKTWPESVSLPDALEDASPVQLAEARFRFSRLAQVAGALRRAVDDELADKLNGGALRYGDDIIRPNNGRGAAKVIDAESWWGYVVKGLAQLDPEGSTALLSALYPASSVRLTGLRALADTVGVEEQTLRDTFISYDHPSSSLSVMPRDRAPKWTQTLEEGEFSGSVHD